MYEISAGSVIFRGDDSRLFLLLNYPSGHWDFVKGRIEVGESTHQTIIRETKEETGIDNLEFVDGFEETINYDFEFSGKLIHKKVIFHLAKTKTEKVTLSQEHINFAWLDYENAMRCVTYYNAKSILTKAEKTLG